jgi:hypothetical protein
LLFGATDTTKKQTQQKKTKMQRRAAAANAISYAKFYSRSHDAVIRVFAPEGSRTVGVWEAGIALGKRIVSRCPEATDLSGRF